MDRIDRLGVRNVVSLSTPMLPVGETACTPCPATSLPAELLTQIFLILRSASDLMISRGYGSRPKTHWIFVIHVCRSWRAAGVGCADLWTTLPVGSPAFSSAVLPWTKDRPLSIEVDLSKGPDAGSILHNMISRFPAADESNPRHFLDMFSSIGQRTSTSSEGLRPVLQDLLSNAGRLRSVDVEFGPHGAPQLKKLLSTWTGEAPILEELVIKCNPLASGGGLPVGFLGGGAPSLRSLQLESTGALWKTIPFSANLTRVYLFEDEEFPTGAPKPTLEEFAAFLKNSVAMEELTLMEYLPRTGFESYYRDGYFKRAQLTLPFLRKLVIHDEKREIHRFALSVHLPKATSIHFLFHHGAYPSETDDILDDLRTAWTDEERGRNFTEGGAKHLEASGQWGSGAFSGHSIGIQFQPPFVRNPAASRTLRVSFNNEDDDEYNSFFHYFPNVNSLHSLNLSKVSKIPALQWRSTFASCPELRTVMFSDSRSFSSFITALQIDFDETKGSGDTSSSERSGPWLPGLKTIQFQGNADKTGFFRQEPLDQRLAGRLIQTLRNRIGVSSPIREVVFQGCYDCDPKTYQLLLSASELGVRLEGRGQNSEAR